MMMMFLLHSFFSPSFFFTIKEDGDDYDLNAYADGGLETGDEYGGFDDDGDDDRAYDDGLLHSFYTILTFFSPCSFVGPTF